eukprot:TRINITY_DN110746_c0_g1_i1.p1 TRINITY_DN110746_c0_g1~~TRINITY_DN110746_c0_g1_i1.p1  ORF type:complete len:566 (-),score=115.97 TRINITY_DN110746_c0_g1_i1:135-1811(-)
MALSHFAGKEFKQVVSSCAAFYPGALATPHRKTFPGEEIFGGQVGYGFNDEFNYSKCQGESGVVVGMGAFAVENIRTLLEHNSNKFYVIARHHNLLLPRVLSWYVNQSRMPPPAATVLKAMEPMYKYYGKDPWSYFSVQANADRSVAQIKQYTRWGVGDVYFLGVFYGKVETVEGQVKRLKHRTAVITNGRVIKDIDHFIKCLGFDSDFGIDQINHTRRHIGYWPDGDYRRWVASDQSAIDASRFGGTAISPYAAMCSYWATYFFNYPEDSKRLLEAGTLPESYAQPESGSAAYHYDPRTAATVQVTYGSSIPEMSDFHTTNDAFKKASMWTIAPPERFLEECEKDWFHYCRKFKEQFNDNREFPAYPYTLDWIYDVLKLEEEDTVNHTIRQGLATKEQGAEHLARQLAEFDQRLAEAKEARRLREERHFCPPTLGQRAILDDAKPVLEDDEWWESKLDPAVDEEQRMIFPDRHPEAALHHTSKAYAEAMYKVQEVNQTPGKREAYLSAAAMLPARMVLRLRASEADFDRPPSPSTRKLNEEWMKGANWVKDQVLQNR